MVDFAELNPLTKFDIGIGAIGNALIMFMIIIVVFGLVGWLIYHKINSKNYYLRIPLYKLVGNVPTRIKTYQAKIFPIGKAGDYLWFVRGIKKFIPPATIQSAPNEFWHWEREDSEWINFSMGDLDDDQKKAGVKYIHQDMRSQRIATANILEQRLINKGFWDKYKDMIIHLIFYIVVMICLIVIFWQWSNIVDQVSVLVDQLKVTSRECNARGGSLIPEATTSLFPLLLFWRKNKWQ